MNTVTFETALALKDAGFPQPEPEIGQFWYNPETKDLGVLSNPVSGHWPFEWKSAGEYFDGYGDVCMEAEEILEFIFAPTATDILALDDSLKIWYSNIEKAFVCRIWVVVDGRLTGRIVTDGNPHEATAHGFMANENKKWIELKTGK